TLFFFSSRRRHTRSDRDWSSDVCSSDLLSKRASDQFEFCRAGKRRSLFEGVVTDRFYSVKNREASAAEQFDIDPEIGRDTLRQRSEERREGKECRSRWARDS